MSDHQTRPTTRTAGETGAGARAELAVCPTCWDEVPVHRLCEHDDPDTGPLCVDTCCPWWHEKEKAA